TRQGQAEGGRLVLAHFLARFVQRSQRAGFQADAARGATEQFDDAFASQGLQVLFCRIGRTKAELGRYFSACGRCPCACNGPLDEFENFLLARREFGFIVHRVPWCVGRHGCSLCCDCIQDCLFVQCFILGAWHEEHQQRGACPTDRGARHRRNHRRACVITTGPHLRGCPVGGGTTGGRLDREPVRRDPSGGPTGQQGHELVGVEGTGGGRGCLPASAGSRGGRHHPWNRHPRRNGVFAG